MDIVEMPQCFASHALKTKKGLQDVILYFGFLKEAAVYNDIERCVGMLDAMCEGSWSATIEVSQGGFGDKGSDGGQSDDSGSEDEGGDDGGEDGGQNEDSGSEDEGGDEGGGGQSEHSGSEDEGGQSGDEGGGGQSEHSGSEDEGGQSDDEDSEGCLRGETSSDDNTMDLVSSDDAEPPHFYDEDNDADQPSLTGPLSDAEMDSWNNLWNDDPQVNIHMCPNSLPVNRYQHVCTEGAVCQVQELRPLPQEDPVLEDRGVAQ